MIESCKTKEEIVDLSQKGQLAFSKLEHSPKPVVAAIMGPCLGGGLEVSPRFSAGTVIIVIIVGAFLKCAFL